MPVGVDHETITHQFVGTVVAYRDRHGYGESGFDSGEYA